MSKPYPPVYYADYLQLDRLLSAQTPLSARAGRPAHDEMLFIVVHQAYELWFKLILHELDSVLALFRAGSVNEQDVGVAAARLQRVTEIQKILIDQLRVLETMTPLDFLDFRDYLVPASGFQSFQFRLLENRLGLKPALRVPGFHPRLAPQHDAELRRSAEEPSLFDVVERWLERTPFLKLEGFDFRSAYRAAVGTMLAGDEQVIRGNPTLTDAERATQLRELEATRENFAALHDRAVHERLVREGKRRLSFEATHAALLIHLYRDQPILHLPFRFLTLLVDVDELLTTWRYRHAIMVHRMIGTRIGTGGSSGHQYLKDTTEQHRIFTDLFNLSTFLIPRSALPALPAGLKERLGFRFSTT